MGTFNRAGFRSTGVWVLLRYLALPVLICVAVYSFGGPHLRTKIHARASAVVTPIQESVAALLGRSEMLQQRVHMRDPEIAPGTATIRISDLPVAARVPVVKLTDLPTVEGTQTVRLSDLPEPVENTYYFLTDKPEPTLAVMTSGRPAPRPVQAALADVVAVDVTGAARDGSAGALETP
ncbi:hypothetical protein [Tropicimonas sediminicola]|uniref:Uncharacterized protein n=1 Tax=Tropicimonas sediminicola TaxID=1031541 RepID=A0A239EZH6_9RHOB|nr:hypothetical protein [Tropicimonas sediminicola]SNS49861.1 hypothetical protein SAMN05421757_102408 [Tropicimonas sediminicola]